MWDAIIKALEEKRAATKAAIQALLDKAESEQRSDLNEAEDTEYRSHVDALKKYDEELKEARDARAREAAFYAAEATETPVVEVRNEPNPVYRADNTHQVSYFRDLFQANVKGNTDARGRLTRSQETRAGDLTTVTGAGGDFAPPLWLVDEFIKLARAGRPLADLMHSEVLPSGVSSINLPKVSTGTAVATQATQNTGVQDTALTTGAVSTGITTVAGQQVVSLQLMEQSGIPFDRVVLGDLAADYARQVDAMVIADLTAISGLISVADSTATIALSNVYSDIANAVNQIATNRFLPPDAIVMSPARWYWITKQFDTSNRPVVVPSGPAFNQVASTGAPQAEGAVGEMLGLPVYLDAQMPISGTSPAPANAVYVLRRDDNWLFESPVQTASFDATYANQLSVLFRIHGYLGFINRYPKSVAQIGGAGYSPAPTF